MNCEKTGVLIRQLRTESNLTQKELAQRLHVTDKAVSKWERGCSLPAVDLLKPLAQELNISVIELLDGQRYEKETIALERANAILEETTKRQRRVIRRKRTAAAAVFLLLLCCFMISGLLLYHQGILLDERGIHHAELYVTEWDSILEWVRYGLLGLLLPLTFVIGASRE